MGRSGPVQVGVRSKAQVHHPSDGPRFVGYCYLIGDLVGPAGFAQLPEQGGGCRCLPNFEISIAFPHRQLLSAFCSITKMVLLRCTAMPQLLALSSCTRYALRAHRPRRSPKADAARRPASALLLPRPVSSRFSRHVRRAAVRIVVSQCPVQTAPGCSGHFPPAACATSCPRPC